jgi:hypothetical protein
MKKRNIELTIETAERWFNGCDRELKELALQTFPELEKNKLPKSWRELKEISGYYVNSDSEIVACMKSNGACSIGPNRNVFATKKQADACIALAQLSQLREVYRNGWVPDFNNPLQAKYGINNFEFLTFQDRETCCEFIDNFNDLIEKAKPLIR